MGFSIVVIHAFYVATYDQTISKMEIIIGVIIGIGDTTCHLFEAHDAQVLITHVQRIENLV